MQRRYPGTPGIMQQTAEEDEAYKDSNDAGDALF